MSRQILEELEGLNNYLGKLCRISFVLEKNSISLSFFSDNVWNVLTGFATDTTSSIVIHDVKEIETWILKLLSAPVPIPGKTK